MKIVYPEKLSDPVFKNRCFTINIIQQPSLADGVEEALQKITDSAKTIFAAVAGSENAGAKDYIKALEENYNKQVDGNTIKTIVLPLPNTFTDNQTHQWNTETGIMGTIGGALESTSVSDIVGKALPGAGAAMGNLGGMSEITASKALGSFANSAGLRKPLVDPGYFQNYTGSEPREFSFSFDLVAESAQDAKSIIEIIMTLKKYGSPEMAPGGVSLFAPHFFDLKIGNDIISGVANVRGLVLKNIGLDYGADGSMQFLPDGTPKYIKMDLTFAERRMMTANDYVRG